MRTFLLHLMPMLQQQSISFRTYGRRTLNTGDFIWSKGGLHGISNLFSDIGLYGEDVIKLTLVSFCPEVKTISGAD